MIEFQVKTNILALDFDGVIADSIKECLVSGYNAYANYSGQSCINHYEELDPTCTGEARRLRNYIRNGEDYVYIAHALASDINIHNQLDFDDFLLKNANKREIFFDHMVNQRISFSEAKPDLWASLNPLYDGMREFLINYPNKENLYIITTKKLLFVHKILDANCIDLVDENIRDTSSGKTKRQIIEEILSDSTLAPEQFYFIDDQVDTLIKVQPTRVNVLFAEWGYNTEAQAAVAEENAIPVVSRDEFFDLFKIDDD